MSFAGPKPSIAVLGLEVVDPNGTPTASDTQAAKELSDGLRARAKAGTGPYQLAPGSDKELIDQKLLFNCDDEKAACMSTIGNQLGAEILMYGRLEKRDKQYQVTIKVLDVGRKQVVKSSSDMIPLSDANGASLQGWAKKIYAKLTGESSAGSLLVKVSNADRGTILIDGEEKGNITNGTGQVTGLSEGKYRVGVESDGFRRWEKEVTINAGQTATLPVELEAGGGDIIGPPTCPDGSSPPCDSRVDGPKRGSTAWKGVFAASVLAAGGGAYLWYSGNDQIKDVKTQLCAGGAYHNADPSCAELPQNDPNRLSDPEVEALNDKGDTGKYKTWGGVALTFGGAGFAIYAFYKGFLAKSPAAESERQGVRGKRVRRDKFIVTPVISPSGGGATLRLDW